MSENSIVGGLAIPLVPQRVWAWRVAFYLGLTSAGAGACLIAQGLWVLSRGASLTYELALLSGAATVGFGAAVILSHLGRPARFYRAAANPMRAWESRGFWLLSFFAAAVALQIAKPHPGAMPLVVGIVALLSAGLVIYGVLTLRSFRTEAVWRTGAHAWLYVSSALLGGWGVIVGNPLVPYPVASLTSLDAAAIVLILIEIAALLALALRMRRLSSPSHATDLHPLWAALGAAAIPLALMVGGVVSAHNELTRMAGLAALGGVVVQRYSMLRLGSRPRVLILRAIERPSVS